MDALDEISYLLKDCDTRGIREISIIHGFHGGQVLKGYIQSEGFLKEMAKEGFRLKRKESGNQGVSCFIVM